MLLLLLLCLTLTSCTNIQNIVADNYYGDMFSDIPLYYTEDMNNITSLTDIPNWMNKKTDYVKTHKVQSPEETLQRGLCDCDGYALLYMNIAYMIFDIKCSLILVNNTPDRKVIDGGPIDHAIVRLPSGKVIHAQTGKEYFGQIAYEYSFDHVFSK